MKSFVLTIFFIACIIATNVAVAQQTKENAHWHYSGLVQVGIVGGSSSITYMAQTVHGIKKNNWFSGIGVGYDNYGMPGIPIVLTGKKLLVNEKTGFLRMDKPASRYP